MSTLLVLLDLSATFDIVDHELILGDLYNCNVRGSAFMILKLYLLGISQCDGESDSETQHPCSSVFLMDQFWIRYCLEMI